MEGLVFLDHVVTEARRARVLVMREMVGQVILEDPGRRIFTAFFRYDDEKVHRELFDDEESRMVGRFEEAQERQNTGAQLMTLGVSAHDFWRMKTEVPHISYGILPWFIYEG